MISDQTVNWSSSKVLPSGQPFVSMPRKIMPQVWSAKPVHIAVNISLREWRRRRMSETVPWMKPSA
jgi:hypothetical protein